MVSERFVRVTYEERKNLDYIKEKLRKLGWKNLNIGSYNRDASGIDKTDNGLFCCWDLRGCYPEYKGPYSDYDETIAITLRKNLSRNVISLSLRKDIANIF